MTELSRAMAKVVALAGFSVMVVGTILGLMSYKDLGNANVNNDQTGINGALGAEIASAEIMLLGIGIIAIMVAFKN